jgi:hypothetical protein
MKINDKQELFVLSWPNHPPSRLTRIRPGGKRWILGRLEVGASDTVAGGESIGIVRLGL